MKKALLYLSAILLTPLLFVLPLVAAEITHGPMLGRPESNAMSVWVRTDRTSQVRVEYGVVAKQLNQKTKWQSTRLNHDNTAVIALTGLTPATTYHYRVITNTEGVSQTGSFHTLQDSELLKDSKYNPRGLSNFRFEFGCGNAQRTNIIDGKAFQPAYDQMNHNLTGRVDFAILNGDFIYEEERDYTADSWARQVGITSKQMPTQVQLTPSISGIWQNYKTYIARSPSLSQWHRNTPSFYTIDDHEILSDVYGSGTAGFRDRRSVHRDTAIQAWMDYIGWSNPQVSDLDPHFSTATMKQGSKVLTDPKGQFTQMRLGEMANLLVHWGGPRAGTNYSIKETIPGDPNARVYDIVKVISDTQLELSHEAAANGSVTYSIGRRNYGVKKMSNADIYILDTRSYRTDRDVNRPNKKGVSMLGAHQLEWLMAQMKNSDAEFFFVVSSVNFMVPHTSSKQKEGKPLTKGESWTVYLEEREKLFNFWDGLGKKVFLLTGDLHNSFAIKITDNIWEFASGPHSSKNHTIRSEGMHPASGIFKYGPRDCDIRWCTQFLSDTTKEARNQPIYCVVQINNVFNNPKRPGQQRLIAFEHPQVIFQFFDGRDGSLRYSETVSTSRQAP